MAEVRLGSGSQIEKSLDVAISETENVVESVMKSWVREVEAQAQALLEEQESLVASTQVPEQGEIEALWEEAVARDILPQLSSDYEAGATSAVQAEGLLGDRLIDEARTVYLATAGDRLVRGLEPPLPDNAWEILREAIDQEIRLGSSIPEISRRIAAEMSWDVDTIFWERRKNQIAGMIDEILDPISLNPRDPARVAARLNDPVVRLLQEQNAYVTARLELEQSWWKTRADLIARTESHGAHEAGSRDAMARVGVEMREWLTASDDRVRASHVAADGQRVAIDEPFRVGASLLMYPGDPMGSARETANCRCVAVGADPGDLVLFPETGEEAI